MLALTVGLESGIRGAVTKAFQLNLSSGRSWLEKARSACYRFRQDSDALIPWATNMPVKLATMPISTIPN
jgi:hypothetical protein